MTTIPEIGISRAAYRQLSSTSQVDVYEFRATAGQEIYVQITVPVIERQRDFAPALVLVSMDPGAAGFRDALVQGGSVFDPDHEIVHEVLGRGDASGHDEPAVLAVRFDGGQPVVFDEPFTGTRYWIRQTLTVRAPTGGTYRIGVWDEEGAVGKYVLAPGRAEKFGAGDLLGFPGVRIKVRGFCEVPTWPDYVFWGALGGVALAGVGLGIWWLLL
jgi:hypothetical protein